MTENITTNNETNTTQNKKHEFGKALTNILLFPLWVVKYAFKYSARLITILLIFCIMAFAIRSAFPMNLPQARNMTYYQFLYHRWTSVKNGMEDPNMAYGVVMYAMMIPTFLVGPAEIPFCEIYPESEFATRIRTHVINGSLYSIYKPRSIANPTLLDIPEMLWESWEKVNWHNLVTLLDRFPAMTYPETDK